MLSPAYLKRPLLSLYSLGNFVHELPFALPQVQLRIICYNKESNNSKALELVHMFIS